MPRDFLKDVRDHYDVIVVGSGLAGLTSANIESAPTYPSRAPRKELDFVLYQEGIEVTGFQIPDVRLSDHLPLVCDFEVCAK